MKGGQCGQTVLQVALDLVGLLSILQPLLVITPFPLLPQPQVPLFDRLGHQQVVMLAPHVRHKAMITGDARSAQ